VRIDLTALRCAPVFGSCHVVFCLRSFCLISPPARFASSFRPVVSPGRFAWSFRPNHCDLKLPYRRVGWPCPWLWRMRTPFCWCGKGVRARYAHFATSAPKLHARL